MGGEKRTNSTTVTDEKHSQEIPLSQVDLFVKVSSYFGLSQNWHKQENDAQLNDQHTPKPAQCTLCLYIQFQCTSRIILLAGGDRSRRSARCFGIPDLHGPAPQGSFHIRCASRSWYPMQSSEDNPKALHEAENSTDRKEW